MQALGFSLNRAIAGYWIPFSRWSTCKKSGQVWYLQVYTHTTSLYARHVVTLPDLEVYTHRARSCCDVCQGDSLPRLSVAFCSRFLI